MARIRITKIALGVLLVTGFLFASCQPDYERVQLESGEEFDVIVLSRDVRAGSSAARGAVWATSVVLNYYAQATTPEGRLEEADQLLELAVPAATKTGDSVIVIQQTYPLLSRWSGLTDVHLVHYYRLPTGAWER